VQAEDRGIDVFPLVCERQGKEHVGRLGLAVARQTIVAVLKADVVEVDRRVAMRRGGDLDDTRGFRRSETRLDEVGEEEGSEVVGAELLLDLAVLR
jgi:hypothetical protein